MDGLVAPEPLARREWACRFRGEPGLEEIRVEVGGLEGVPPSEVAANLGAFIRKLQAALGLLERTLGERVETPEHLRLLLQTTAWAHAEWIRIHPFANGNGRTARLWANWLFMRFGLPPFIRLRPRPAGDVYARAGREALKGNWTPTLRAFEELLP